MGDFVFAGYPWERLVLLALASLRALFTVGFAGLAYLALQRSSLPRWFVILVLVVVIPFGAFLCADGIEPLLKSQIFDYDYNPYVMAIGEWEGWMGPTSHGDIATWQTMKCGPPPGGNVEPLMPWWGNPADGRWCKKRVVIVPRNELQQR